MEPGDPGFRRARARLVGDVMRRDFIRLDPDEDLLNAMLLMGMARVRELPVVREGGLAGMVSHRELAEAALGRAAEGGTAALAEPIAAWVQRDPPTVTPEATLEDAASLMVRELMACLPVLGGEGGDRRLLGIVTEADLLREAFQAGGRR